jgi:hypothetical protein
MDVIKRKVHVKLTGRDYMLTIINDTKGRAKYKHATGEISIVEIAVAGMGHKKNV